jgi:hypothetical protein
MYIHNELDDYQFYRTHPYVQENRRLAYAMARYAESTDSIPRPARWVLLFGEEMRDDLVHTSTNKNQICSDGKLRWVWRYTT